MPSKGYRHPVCFLSSEARRSRGELEGDGAFLQKGCKIKGAKLIRSPGVKGLGVINRDSISGIS
jgi:hypothetical protein